MGVQGVVILQGPKHPTALWGEPQPFPHFEERIKSHMILIKTELFCHHLSLQGCAPIATHIISFRGAALKFVAQSCWWKASVLEGVGNPVKTSASVYQLLCAQNAP